MSTIKRTKKIRVAPKGQNPKRPKGTKTSITTTTKRRAKGGAVRRVKTVAATSALLREGSHGKDLRAAAYDEPSDEDCYVPTQSSIAVEAQLNFESIRSCAMGIVLDALSRGWRTQNGEPYYAAVFLYRSLINVVKGTFPSIQNAPQWFWLLSDALFAKEKKFKTGVTQYSWTLFGTDQFDPITLFDSTAVVFGTPSAAEINGLSVLATPAPYNDDAGADAIQSLFKFYPEGVMTTRSSMSQGESHAGKDVSSFATVYPEIGSAFSSPGGVATTLSTECFIDSPVFSQFALYQTGPKWRGFQEYRKNAGTPMSVIPRMLSMRTVAECRTKVSPIYKFWDFDEFFEVLSLTLSSAMEAREASGGPGTLVPITCPLTSQETQIILRQTILQKMKNHFGLDLRYNSSNAVDFYPMSVANNGVDYTVRGVSGMDLPQLLAENIRAAGRMLKQVPTPIGGTTTYDIIPILGRYDVNQLKNYTWTDLAGVPHDVYKAPGVEVAINIRNMSALDPLNQLVYLDANGDQIEKWVTDWNEFMQKLSQNLTPLTCPGKEKGINALACNPLTAHHVKFIIIDDRSVEPASPQTTKVQPGGVVTELKKKVSAKGPFKIGTPRRPKKVGASAPGPGSEFYQSICTASVSTTYPLESSSWNFQKAMILPTYIGDGGLSFEGTVSAQQSFQVEPKLLILVPDGDGQQLIGDGFSRSTLYEKHLTMARMDIKATFGEEGSETERALNALIAQGRGGWFTSIAGSFLEAVGVKGAKGVADAIGYATGL